MQSGTLLGHYHLLQAIGEGSLGRVYQAMDTRTQTLVAVKVLHDRYRSDPKFTGVFYRELMMQQRVNHPHLVRYLDGCYDPPLFYMVTQWIDGWTLKQVIRHCARLPPLVSLAIAWQMAQGLDGLHLQDLIHADLSSSNIIIERSGKVYLTDFSLVLDTHLESYKNMIVGTPGYYSPEHLTAEAVVTASDIYVLGLLIFEMIQGKKLVPELDARTHGQLVMNAMKSPQTAGIKCTENSLQSAMHAILQNMLEPLVQKRMQSIEALTQQLASVLTRSGINDPIAAVQQFLVDGQFTGLGPSKLQNIYWGYQPYTIDDIQLLAVSS